jgi:subtilisin family serine protease
MKKLIYSLFLFFFLTGGILKAQIFYNSQDVAALESLLFSTGGGTRTIPQGWNQALGTGCWCGAANSDVANWDRISWVLVGFEYRAQTIDLSGLGLNGSLPNDFILLGTMDSLKILNLSNNFISSGPSTAGIWSASNLVEMDLSNNQFDSIAAPDLLLKTLTGATAMKKLSMRNFVNSALLSLNTPSLPSALLNLAFLDMGENNIIGDISQITNFLPNVKTLYLDNNLFSDFSLSVGMDSLETLDIGLNKLDSVSVLQNILELNPRLKFFSAKSALNTTASINYPLWQPFQLEPFNTNTEIFVDISNNNLSGSFDFSQSFFSKIKYFDISNNLLDSIAPPLSQLPCRFISISNNQLDQPLDLAWFTGFPNAEELMMRNNGFYGPLPEFSGYLFDSLKTLDISSNEISGALRFDLILSAQLQNQNSPIKSIKVSDNNFNAVVMPTVPFAGNQLEYLYVFGNQLYFDALNDMKDLFGFVQIPVNLAGGVTTTHYVPAHLTVTGSIFDTLNTFKYWPQDSAGIGGVRRRPSGENVIFASTVGEPRTFYKNDLTWFRSTFSGFADTLGTVDTNSPGFGGNVTISATAAGLSSRAQISLNNPTNLLEIVDLDSTLHNAYYYYASVKNDSFPFLTVPVRPKKLIVGPCFDNFGGETLCQQMVVQFVDSVSINGKEEIRKEFGIDVIDSCVCGSIELWAFPDTLNQIEMENLGTGTRTTTGQANNKAELLSADPNYALLGSETGTPLIAPNFSTGTTNTNPVLVAIVDSGVDYLKPEIVQRFWVKPGETSNNGLDDDHDCEIDNGWGWNYLHRNNITYDDHGHGTSVAAVVMGYNPENLSYNPAVSDPLAVVPYKYTDKSGAGTVFHAACALRHAADYRDTLSNGNVARVRVINASWGYYGEPCMVLENAILYSGRQCDVLIVTSAGNRGQNTQIEKHWPSNSPFVADSSEIYNDNVIAVAALSPNNPDFLASYSNFSTKHIDLAAFGTVNVFGANDPTNTLITETGTSFAAPQVARIAGLLFNEFPDAGAGAVKYALMMGVDTLQSSDMSKIKSGGRINYQKARNILMNIVDRTICDESGFVLSSELIENSKTGSLSRIFPNPFSNELQIVINPDYLISETEIEIAVTDISGRTVYYEIFEDLSNIQLKTDSFSPGLYFISLKYGVTKQISKVIKF